MNTSEYTAEQPSLPTVRIWAEWPNDDPMTPNSMSVDIDASGVSAGDIAQVVAALSRVYVDARPGLAERQNGGAPTALLPTVSTTSASGSPSYLFGEGDDAGRS